MSSIPATTIDPSRRLDLPFRLKRAGNKKFIFLNSSGAGIDISTFGFQLNVKEYPGARSNIISLTIGSGLTISGSSNNELNASFTDSQTNVKEAQYYWELYKGLTAKTYLNGWAPGHNGIFDGVDNDTSSIIIDDNGNDVTINIDDGGSTPVGMGDVTGPSGATDSNFPVFDGSTGKLIKDSGFNSGSFQPVDIDLSIIAALSPTNDDIIQRKSGAWSNRTLAQYAQDLQVSHSVTFIADTGAATQWANMPAVSTEYQNSNLWRRKVDLTRFRQYRIIISRVTVIGVAGSGLYLKYSTDNSTYIAMGTETTTNLALLTATGGPITSSWIDIPAGAKGDVFIAPFGIGGDGVADPSLWGLHAEFRT